MENESINNKRMQESAGMDVVRQFAGVVAHDLNNLLTGIMGFAMLILEDMDEGNEFYSYMKEIEKSAIKCRNLTDKLISFSSEIVLEKCKTDIKKAIEDGLDQAKRVLSTDAEIVTNFGETPLADLDAEKISHIIVCILADAEYRSGKINKIDISSSQMKIAKEDLEKYPAINREGEYILINICVDGITVTDEDMESLFNPRFKTGKKILMGCELAVVREVVEKHGGSISAASGRGGKFVFDILLPVGE